MITGGLNKGVDHLIGNEVKNRLVNGERLPRAVLGICNWGWLEMQKVLRNVRYSIFISQIKLKLFISKQHLLEYNNVNTLTDCVL